MAFLRDSNLTRVRTFAVLELPLLELDGSYRLEGRGGGAWAWLGADYISSQVAHQDTFTLPFKGLCHEFA